nr:hypothetical protein [Tanacetum cinerariifolium]
MRSIISMVSISLEVFIPFILLLVVIIVAVVIVAVVLVDVVIDAIVEVVIVVASIGVVVVVMIIGIVVIVDGGVSHIIKLSFVIIGFFNISFNALGKSPDESFHNFLGVCPGDPIGLFYFDRLSVCIPPRQGIIGQVFLLGLSAFAMAAACASRAAATPSVISFRMVALVIAGVADVDVLLGGIYQHIHANIE